MRWPSGRSAARERTFGHTIEGYVTLAAAQKNRVVATVRVARPLTAEQRDRLRPALSQQVGREVAMQEIIDPDVLGGVRVELGDEVIEGTVAGRLRRGPQARSARTRTHPNTGDTIESKEAMAMAELTIRPEEIRDALDRFVENYTPDTSSREEVGTVVTSGDGIARVEGLPSAMANELLEFENGTLGHRPEPRRPRDRRRRDG